MSKFEKLSDIGEVIDSLHKTPKYSDVGRAMVRCTDVKYGRLDLTNTFKVSEEVFAEFSRRYTPKKDDIIITRVGSYGITALVEDDDFCLGQNTSVIVPKAIDPRYLYLALNSFIVKNQIEFSVVGSTQKTLSLKAINNLDIPRFDLEVEKKIAKIVGQLDDKIELNRQTNQTLEYIAQALFKCWFVDFEPTRAKIIAKEKGENSAVQELAAQAIICGAMTLEQLEAITQNLEITLQQAINKKLNQANQTPINTEQLKTTAALFPNALVDSELGEIPEGWGCKALSEWGAIICGKTPSKKKDEYYGGDIPFIKIPDMHGNMYVIESVDTLTEEGAETQRKKILPEGSICVSCIATVGQVVITCEESFTNQQINSIIPIERFYTPYLYFSMLEQNKNIHDLASGGSATLNLNTGNFSKIEIVRPHSELLKKFSVLVESMLKDIITNQLQQKELTSIRDTLLPKLLSGELNVSSD